MKQGKRLAAVISVLGLMLFLSGCSTDPVNAQSTGIWDHYIVWNFIRAIEAFYSELTEAFVLSMF